MRFIIHNSLGPVAAEPDLESGAEEVRQKTVPHAFLLYILGVLVILFVFYAINVLTSIRLSRQKA